MRLGRVRQLQAGGDHGGDPAVGEPGEQGREIGAIEIGARLFPQGDVEAADAAACC